MVDDVTDLSIEYDDAGVKKTIYRLPPSSSPLPSVAAFSLPKAGSVLLHSVLLQLSEAAGVTYVAIMSELFALGLVGDNIPPSTERIFRKTGYCYGGFRQFPSQFKLPDYLLQKAMLLVRDPRDMVVSHYFSLRYSHPKPGTKNVLSTGQTALPEMALAAQLPLDDYVLEIANKYKQYIGSYLPVLRSVAVFRYEDILFNKRWWLWQICRHFGWKVPGQVRRRIADQNDLFPDAEDVTRHIRQVLPGDFRRKLRPETIARLNEIFAEELALFGYDRPLAPRMERLRNRRRRWEERLATLIAG